MADFKLSYGSVVLNTEDVAILQSDSWFNDKLLSFIGDYLMSSANEAWKKATKTDEVLLHVFTPPETEMIRHASSDDEVEMYFGMLGIKDTRLVAFIVNNNTNPERAHGGSHWSLLVYDRSTDMFRHFDSSVGYNHDTATTLIRKAGRLVGQINRRQKLRHEDVVQQTNGRDCGLFAAGYLWVLAETSDIDAIGRIETIEQTRKFWTDFIVNFPNRDSFEAKFRNIDL